METKEVIIITTTEDLKQLYVEMARELKADLYEILESRLNREVREAEGKPQPLEGIEGIALALHCSKSKAQRLKADGMLEGGIKQYGKTIIVPDATALQDIVTSNMQKRKASKRGRRVNYSLINNKAI